MNTLPRLKTLLVFQCLIMALVPLYVWLFLQGSNLRNWLGLLALAGGLLQNRLESRVEKQLDECARKSLNQADANQGRQLALGHFPLLPVNLDLRDERHQISPFLL